MTTRQDQRDQGVRRTPDLLQRLYTPPQEFSTALWLKVRMIFAPIRCKNMSDITYSGLGRRWQESMYYPITSSN